MPCAPGARISGDFPYVSVKIDFLASPSGPTRFRKRVVISSLNNFCCWWDVTIRHQMTRWARPRAVDRTTRNNFSARTDEVIVCQKAGRSGPTRFWKAGRWPGLITFDPEEIREKVVWQKESPSSSDSNPMLRTLSLCEMEKIIFRPEKRVATRFSARRSLITFERVEMWHRRHWQSCSPQQCASYAPLGIGKYVHRFGPTRFSYPLFGREIVNNFWSRRVVTSVS